MSSSALISSRPTEPGLRQTNSSPLRYAHVHAAELHRLRAPQPLLAHPDQHSTHHTYTAPCTRMRRLTTLQASHSHVTLRLPHQQTLRIAYTHTLHITYVCIASRRCRRYTYTVTTSHTYASSHDTADVTPTQHIPTPRPAPAPSLTAPLLQRSTLSTAVSG